MSAHTPGPWTVDPLYPRDILADDGSDVATTSTPNGTGNKPIEEAAANARLIAAAPELLHFALWAKQVCDGPLPLPDAQLREALSRCAGEAIAKAEGR